MPRSQARFQRRELSRAPSHPECPEDADANRVCLRCKQVSSSVLIHTCQIPIIAPTPSTSVPPTSPTISKIMNSPVTQLGNSRLPRR